MASSLPCGDFRESGVPLLRGSHNPPTPLVGVKKLDSYFSPWTRSYLSPRHCAACPFPALAFFVGTLFSGTARFCWHLSPPDPPTPPFPRLPRRPDRRRTPPPPRFVPLPLPPPFPPPSPSPPPTPPLPPPPPYPRPPTPLPSRPTKNNRINNRICCFGRRPSGWDHAFCVPYP